MNFKDVAVSDASTEAKVAALALLLDKELMKLADVVLNVKKLQGPQGEQGLQGPKGEQGDRGFDGVNGKDGNDGRDGRDGEEGKQGVGVSTARIDFDGSLVITLTDGTEINVGEVVPLDTAEKIKVIGNGGGTSQSVLDAIAAINATIATYGTMALQNANNVAITGGAVDGTTIGGTTPAAGTFTTLSTGALTATGQTSLGGAAGSESLRVTSVASAVNWVEIAGDSSVYPSVKSTGAGSAVELRMSSKGGGSVGFFTNNLAQRQLNVSHTASAVNYVQVTGNATGSGPIVSAQGSDTNVDLLFSAKGTAGSHVFRTNSTVRQFQINHVTSAVNYGVVTGSIAGNAVPFTVAGSDINISQVFQSKGTGAIDLAAGSSGVNISNGGTVTAITMTNNGTIAYTSHPTPAITAPTTAGGVQATASSNLYYNSAIASTTIVSGGTGYTVNDVLTVSGGTFTAAATFTVSSVSGGVVTGITATAGGTYSVIPTGTLSVTGGTGSGFTFTINGWAVRSLNITNAGSGYVEQPTVTFSGGGGSGAAAYATVGSGTVVRTLGSAVSFYTPAGEQARISDTATTSDSYVELKGGTANTGGVYISARGTARAINMSSGSGQRISFFTGGEGSLEQLRVSHTASAVNYVQVTGAATTGTPVISSQGSDSNVYLRLQSKGTGGILFTTGGGTPLQINNTNSTANRLEVTGSVAGSAPILSAAGSDTNIDLALTPKGTGRVQFGTYTANMALTVQGYIEIKDSGGTVRKLAVIA